MNTTFVDRVRIVFTEQVSAYLAKGFIIDPFSLNDRHLNSRLHVDLIKNRTTIRVAVTVDDNRNYCVVVSKYTKGFAPYISDLQMTIVSSSVIG